jgi:hypothetical protein
MFRKLALAAAAAAFAATSATAAPLPQRAPASIEGQDEHIVGLLWQYIILPIVVAAVLGLVLGNDDDETPASP